MRYADILDCDVVNGEGIGISLFVQGCHFHCYNCFNQEAWDFSSGKEWTDETQNQFLEMVDKPYVNRVSILGGEPLASENLETVFDIINKIRSLGSNKKIWLYTGYTAKLLKAPCEYANGDDAFCCGFAAVPTDSSGKNVLRSMVMSSVDILVDGRYIDEQKDLSLKWRGSSNQRVIDVQASIKKGETVLWCT